jgi:hypothetical protein
MPIYIYILTKKMSIYIYEYKVFSYYGVIKATAMKFPAIIARGLCDATLL